MEDAYETTTQKVNNVVKVYKEVVNGDTDSSGMELGILPNKTNYGGITEQILSSTSDTDRDRKQINVISTNNTNYDKLTPEQKAQYTPIEDTEYFKSLPQSKQMNLKVKD